MKQPFSSSALIINRGVPTLTVREVVNISFEIDNDSLIPVYVDCWTVESLSCPYMLIWNYWNIEALLEKRNDYEDRL